MADFDLNELKNKLEIHTKHIDGDVDSDSGHVSEQTESDSEKNKVEEINENKVKQENIIEEKEFKLEIVWFNVIFWIIFHTLFLYSLTLLPLFTLPTWIFLLITYQISGAGITAGAHRLWSHKTYQAKLPLRIFLAIGNSMAGQNSIYIWSRDHRTHHKCSETVGDPHNAKRGFFFAHMGWLLCRKHPQVIKSGKTIDMSDLEADPVVMFQHRNYLPCMIIFSFVIPTLLPYFCWGEDLSTAYFAAVVRYISVLHSTWLVNSAAHFFGGKPYDKNIGPTENSVVSLLAMGEGHHNYHHVFPFDYSTSEWGYSLNITKVFIDAMAWMGLAYNLRTTKAETIAARAARTGRPEETAGWRNRKLD